MFAHRSSEGITAPLLKELALKAHMKSLLQVMTPYL